MTNNKQPTFFKELRLFFLIVVVVITALLFTLIITGGFAESGEKFLVGCFLLRFLLLLLLWLLRLEVRAFWAGRLKQR